MYVKSVEFENLRCFKKGRIEFRYPGDGLKTPDGVPNFDNVNVILGINGSGKTTALKAVALAMIGQFPRQTGFVPYDLVRQQSDEGMLTKIKVSVLPTEAENVKQLEFESIIKAVHSTEEIFPVKPNDTEIFFDEKSSAYFLIAYGATRRVETENFTPAARRKERFARYQRIASLFEEQFTLLPLSAWLEQIMGINLDNTRWQEQDDLLHTLLPEGITRDSVSLTNALFEQNYTVLRFSALPDGYRAYIGWIVDLIHHISVVCPEDLKLNSLQGVVMVDEIDLHVHPTWQRSIIAHVAKALPFIQFIFTTHSPIVAGSVSSQNLWVTRTLEDGSSSIERPSTEIYGLNADQILTSDVFGLESTRAEGFLHNLETLERKAVRGDSQAALDLMRAMARGQGAIKKNPEPPAWVKKAARRQKSV